MTYAGPFTVYPSWGRKGRSSMGRIKLSVRELLSLEAAYKAWLPAQMERAEIFLHF